jgi:hypothetical protein
VDAGRTRVKEVMYCVREKALSLILPSSNLQLFVSTTSDAALLP